MSAPLNINTTYVSNVVKVPLTNQVWNYIVHLWVYFSNGGIREGQKATDSKRVRLTNQFAIFGIVICTLELPVYFYLGAMTSVILITFIDICLIAVLILNRYFLNTQAKVLLYVMIDLVLIYSSGYLGKESGLYLSFFSVIIGPFILFDLKEKSKIAVLTLMAVTSVYVIEYVDLSAFSDPTITPEMRKFVFQSTLMSSFISVIFCVYLLVKENAISENSLSESGTLFRELLDATPDSTIITDSNGFITLCNKQVETTFGYQTDELLGEHINILIPARLKDQTAGYFNLPVGSQKKPKETSGYLFVAKKDKTEIAVEISQNSYLAKTGTMMIVVIRDVTKRKQHEQELVQFSYVVSHDLKAPLRAIFRLSEWIEEELGSRLSGDLKTNFGLLRGRVFRLESLINGLLEYSKIGRIQVKKEKVNTQVLIHEVIDLLAPPSHMEINIQAGMPVFETQKILFQQVFFNLLSNAIKYNDKKRGIINITAGDKGKFYEFTIEDNGIGIDPKYHEKIFVIFQTLEARDKVEGTGIGLTIIKKSVEDVGGTISLQSEPGKGSRFTFTWPQLINTK